MPFSLRPTMLATCILATPLTANAREVLAQSVTDLKAKILALAESYKGTGDPDRSKQATLEALVKDLIAASNPPPVAQRLHLIEGAWKQVWGPYDYASDKRGVDKNIDPDHIYQIIFPGGFYYNVNPTSPQLGKVRTGILRGIYEIVPDKPHYLWVKFTKFNQVPRFYPAETDYLRLPFASENRTLEGERWFLPPLVVKTFFGNGALHEVYTDHDLRITFGSDRKNLDKNFIYILKRVPLPTELRWPPSKALISESE